MNQDDNNDRDIAALLRAAGRREQLAPERKQQWERAFREQLQPVLERRRRRRSVILGLGACAALVLAVALLPSRAPVSGIEGPRITTLSGRVSAENSAGTRLALRRGQVLAPGTRLTTPGDGFLGLDYGAYSLRLKQDSRMTLRRHSVFLSGGTLYASDRAHGPDDPRLVVETPLGSIRDVGTQFMVEVQPGQTVTTVRRGAIVLDTGDFEHRAAATDDYASRLIADSQRQVLTESAAPAGPQWQWIYQGAREFSIDGRTAWEFLQWAVAESGLRLQFADERAQLRARSTVLRGDIASMHPEQAIDAVLATTDLRASVEDGHRLRVALQDGTR